MEHFLGGIALLRHTLKSEIVVVHGHYFWENFPVNMSLFDSTLLLIFTLFPNNMFIEPDLLNLRNGSDTAQKVIRIFIIRF